MQWLEVQTYDRRHCLLQIDSQVGAWLSNHRDGSCHGWGVSIPSFSTVCCMFARLPVCYIVTVVRTGVPVDGAVAGCCIAMQSHATA